MSTNNHTNLGNLLLAEDDQGVRESLERALGYEGYNVTTASDGREAIVAVGQQEPDLLILDVMMPQVDGLMVAKRLRKRGDTLPILMLTARTEVGDRVAGLDAGADDYLAKPFAFDELLARIRALLRRQGISGRSDQLVVGDLTLDPMSRMVTRGEHEIELTRTEFDLLELLMFNAGIVISRTQIFEEVWGYDFGTNSNSIDVYIGYLRRKTEPEGMSRMIHTVRGVGYIVREPK